VPILLSIIAFSVYSFMQLFHFKIHTVLIISVTDVNFGICG